MPEENPPARETLLQHPGTLWANLSKQTEHALRCGALHSIPTEYEFVEQNGVPFLVRIVSDLVSKEDAKKQQEQKTATSGKRFNPFLPYDKNLFVADISNTHLCLLNKYNVVDNHLLIVTRAFEAQENWLNWQDFEAMWASLAEIDGLAFYNAGKAAGASQPHKHLQLVPLPLTPGEAKLPIEPALAAAKFPDSVGTLPSFPFQHAITRLNPNWVKSPSEAGKATLERYHALLRAVSLSDEQSGAYNLLATRQWMLLVPRTQEYFESIGVNSLGFAGVFLVRDRQQMRILKEWGPMTILKGVAPS